jgi:hypothetical protein
MAKLRFGMGVVVGIALILSLVGDRLQSAPSDRVCFEAEDAKSITPHFKKRTTPFKDSRNILSSGGCIEIPEKINGEEHKEVYEGVVTYEVNIPSAGEYAFWARVYWGPDKGCSNSFWVSLNGGAPQVFGEDGTYLVWHWIKLKDKVDLPQGKVPLVLKNREDGIMIDQIFLTKGAIIPVGKMAVTPGALAH